MKKQILVCALLALAAECLAGAPFKIMSYNIHHCADMRGVLSPKATGGVIAGEKVLFAALQEVDVNATRTGGVDQPAVLAGVTGLHATFGKAIPLQGGEYGNALLSREKPISARKFPLPGKEPRMLLLCEFEDCFVGSMHLAVDSAEARERSVPLVRAAVESCGGAKPVFLCGDWNAKPDSAVLKALGEFMKVVSITTDATFPGGKASSFERMNRGNCIDYVAVDRAHADRVAVHESHVTQDFMTSDHAPVVVTVSIKEK